MSPSILLVLTALSDAEAGSSRCTVTSVGAFGHIVREDEDGPSGPCRVKGEGQAADPAPDDDDVVLAHTARRFARSGPGRDAISDLAARESLGHCSETA